MGAYFAFARHRLTIKHTTYNKLTDKYTRKCTLPQQLTVDVGGEEGKWGGCREGAIGHTRQQLSGGAMEMNVVTYMYSASRALLRSKWCLGFRGYLLTDNRISSALVEDEIVLVYCKRNQFKIWCVTS